MINIYLINHISAKILTTGRMIPLGLIVHQQRYRPSDINKDIDTEFSLSGITFIWQ